MENGSEGHINVKKGSKRSKKRGFQEGFQDGERKHRFVSINN